MLQDDVITSIPPPSYSQSDTTILEETTGDNNLNELPPAYHVAAKLPTYEEAELNKDPESRHLGCENRDDESVVKVGTDGLFALCFIVAFIFNWIGFIFAYCVTNTVAGRYGALSGFGLSLIKWVFIFKHSKCCKDLVFQDAWLWWLFALLGWLIFIRGILVYIQVKKIVKAGQQIHVPRYWGLTRTE